jgi:predicted alpha/beta-fold hydrolase
MATALGESWDILSWNYRGCSGEPNRLLRSYHSGATEDLRTVLGHTASYDQVALVGFSLGGNLVVKYLGEEGAAAAYRISGAVVMSVPADLAAGSFHLADWTNAHYMRRFMRSLRSKIRAKATLFPGALDLAGLESMRTFEAFDDRYTAPLHGFRDAADYWAKCSCGPFVESVRVPVLWLSSEDDPFLPEVCYPRDACSASPFVFLECTRWGGHVGFLQSLRTAESWSEQRTAAWLETL